MDIILTIVATLVVASVVVVIWANLSFPRGVARYELREQIPIDDPRFRRTLSGLVGTAIVSGNRVQMLSNGDEYFPAMLSAIQNAESTITLESYIFWPGEIAGRFAEALAERARAGVRAHVLLDWAGSHTMDPAHAQLMNATGVELRKYRPLRCRNLLRMNNRSHRRILVVDGRVGFIGGMGIGDVWAGQGDRPEEWRDLQVRAEGPVVRDLQATFVQNWLTISSEVLEGDGYFPELCIAGEMDCQAFRSHAGDKGDKLWLLYALCFAAARQRILIANAYFGPDDRAVDALVAARRRGVDVQILIPGPHIDVKLTVRSSQALWGELLGNGIAIHRFQPTMYHCKYLIIDDEFVSIGSANFDERSFRLNDELNLNIFDRGFTRRQIELFETDKSKSRPVDYQEWQQRSWRERAMEKVCGIMRTQV